jgi:phage terminase small subunit
VAADLTELEHAFLRAYYVSLNGAQAYLVVHPEAKYSTACSESSRILKKPRVRAELAAWRKSQQERTEITADKILKEHARIAFSDITSVADLSDPSFPKLKPLKDIGLDDRHIIQSVKPTKFGIAIELKSATSSLAQLTRRLHLDQPVAPLETLLNALPPALAAELRLAMAGIVASKGSEEIDK